MKGWTFTRVWNIDGVLFVAKTIEEAVALWRIRNKTVFDKPHSIEGITSGNCEMDYEAIISDKTEE